MILPQKNVFQNIKIKLNLRTWMTLKSSVVIFQALELLQPNWPHRPLQPHWPLQPQKLYFTKQTSWSWWLDHPWHQNDQYGPLFVEWIIKNPIFHWYLIPFLLEAVEASRCHFFENWLMQYKFSYCTQMTNASPFLWNGSSKIQFFTDIWYPFCRRLLRPAYVTFLKTGWWNSNFQTSRTN